MCGITGYYSPTQKYGQQHLETMANSLAHRGPDAAGYFTDEVVGLGHRRLSIIDLSEQANQPMHSKNNRYVICYNGEVYNFQELAKELDIPFKTTSDTEVVLEAFSRWGIDFVQKLNGMFSMAIYDKEQKELYLFRDRIGIKPLYYYHSDKTLVFASELKALLTLDIPKKINKTALNDYLFLEYIPAPITIIEDIYKLEPGHYLKIGSDGLKHEQYYNILDKVEPVKAKKTEGEYLEELESLLTSSIEYRSISDVPIGAFLSGGTDSSAICAKFQEINNNAINTFNIGFDVVRFDESGYAKSVAEILETKHHKTRVSTKTFIDSVENIVDHYDEPFAVPSVFPTMQVCKIAKDQITVASSGDGGDELFMGYGYYSWYNRIKRVSNFGGYAARKATAMMLSRMDTRKQRAGRIFDYKHFDRIWLHIWSQEQYMFSEKEIQRLCNMPYVHETIYKDWEEINKMPLHMNEKISIFDIRNYLASNLLHKMDIASMASSLEVRTPLLDHRLVEFAVNLPLEYKIKNGEQKYLLKKLLEKYLPKQMIYRKKWGFPAPIEYWLLTDLQYMLEKYLSKKVLERHGLFDPVFVAQLVEEFKSGKRYHSKRIWALILFNMWYNKYIEKIV
jgi:asparagine synthase (glutamine-hydrolysing)